MTRPLRAKDARWCPDCGELRMQDWRTPCPRCQTTRLSTQGVADMAGVSRWCLYAALRTHPDLQPSRLDGGYYRWTMADAKRIRAFFKTPTGALPNTPNSQHSLTAAPHHLSGEER